MSISISNRSLPIFADFAAGSREISAATLPIRLLFSMADARRRRAERRMAMMVEELGHPGVIADFQRTTRGATGAFTSR